MRGIVSASVLGVVLVVCLLAFPSSAHAQWCDQVCAEGYGGNEPSAFPMCDVQCNAGGGNYTTCGGASYPCCYYMARVEQFLGYKFETHWSGVYCDYHKWEQWRNGKSCPDGDFWAATSWCAENVQWLGFGECGYYVAPGVPYQWGQNYC